MTKPYVYQIEYAPTTSPEWTKFDYEVNRAVQFLTGPSGFLPISPVQSGANFADTLKNLQPRIERRGIVALVLLLLNQVEDVAEIRPAIESLLRGKVDVTVLALHYNLSVDNANQLDEIRTENFRHFTITSLYDEYLKTFIDGELSPSLSAWFKPLILSPDHPATSPQEQTTTVSTTAPSAQFGANVSAQRGSSFAKKTRPNTTRIDLSKPRYKEFLHDVVFNYKPVPPPDEPYYYPPYEQAAVEGTSIGPDDAWVMAGASVRGFTHQNVGTHRDDAFFMGAEKQWNIVALADGAGSAKLSRETANQSVLVAVERAAAYAIYSENPKEAKDRIEQALNDAIHAVHRTHWDITNTIAGGEKRQTYTTFLMLIHHPLSNGRGNVFGWVQIGDGYIAAANSRNFNPIGEGDHGSDASGTVFVTSLPEEKLSKRVHTFYTDGDIDIFLLMTDGIENDLKPSSEGYAKGERIEANVERFTRRLQASTFAYRCWEDWGELLLQTINYERVGSNDDRTLAVITRKPHDATC